MKAKTVSVDLDSTNLLWLQARAQASGHRSVSDVLNEVVARARRPPNSAPADRSQRADARSVVGLASISGDDPRLENADAAIRRLFEESVNRFPTE